MANPFQSKFKSNQALKDCLARDNANIWEGNNRTGEHVALLHEALKAWRDKQVVPPGSAPLPELDAGEVANKEFGRKTSAVVFAFKKANTIKNYKGEFDPIVGRKTVAALDGQLPFKPDDDPNKNKDDDKNKGGRIRVLDIVIQFHGIPPTDERAGKETTDDPFLNVKAFKDAAVEHGQPRDIEVLNLYGKPGTEVVDLAVKLFDDRVAGRKLGMVIVAGSSIGGRNAAEFIGRKPNVSLRYAAFLDAAFDDPSDIMLKKKIEAEEAVSVYQSMTYGWADLLGSPEYHGAITGTKGIDVTFSKASAAKNRSEQDTIDKLRGNWFMPKYVKYQLTTFPEKRVHDRAVTDGWGIAGVRIVDIIKSAPPPPVVKP